MCMPPASQCCNVKSCSVETCLAAMLQICCQSPTSSVHMQPTGAPPSNKTHVNQLLSRSRLAKRCCKHGTSEWAQTMPWVDAQSGMSGVLMKALKYTPAPGSCCCCCTAPSTGLDSSSTCSCQSTGSPAAGCCFQTSELGLARTASLTIRGGCGLPQCQPSGPL